MLRDDDDQVTLIDMGVAKSGPKVMAALAFIGSGPSDVTRLMLTHAHADHAGGAAYVAEQTGREFGIHADDAEFGRVGKNPPRDAHYLLGRLMTRSDRASRPCPSARRSPTVRSSRSPAASRSSIHPATRPATRRTSTATRTC